MKSIYYTVVFALLSALLTACDTTPIAPGHARRDPSSICNKSDPYCESRVPAMDPNGNTTAGPKAQ